jgi:hypothetical protein
MAAHLHEAAIVETTLTDEDGLYGMAPQLAASFDRGARLPSAARDAVTSGGKCRTKESPAFVSCCRFDGRLVKLIPASVRTQQG